jgi:Core-2/I-Branching enzyme
MRIANIIVAHKNPNQLLRLINQYPASHFHNYVHVDAKLNIADYAAIANHPNVTMLPRISVVWAGFTFVKVVIDALKQVTNGKDQYQYFSVMSGMDFPVRPANEFVAFLEDAYTQGPKEFFEICDLSEWPAKHRYERYHLSDWTMKGRYFTERIINWFVPKRKFWGGRMEPYGYSAWFTASDKFISYALKFFEENPGYLSFLKTTWNPDEFTFCTLIMNSPFRDKLGPGNLRLIDWSEGKAHPKLFKTGDLVQLLNSGKFIARKFDEGVDREIINQLEESLNSKSKIVHRTS